MTHLDKATMLLPTVPFFQAERKNWPPPPRVKDYDAAGIEKPKSEDTPDIAELKKDKAIFIFAGIHDTAKMADSVSTVELERSEHRGGASKTVLGDHSQLDIDPARSSLMSVADNVSKMLEKAHAGDEEESSEGGQNVFKKKKKKRMLDEIPKTKKKGAKVIPRMSRLALREFLKSWDKGSNSQRICLIQKFLEDYTTQDPLDLDFYLSKSGTLIFTRLIVGMQISFQCKKPVAHHFMALGIFIKSFDGERYTYEFAMAGAFQTSFEVLRVHEMTNHDKMHAFHLLFLIIDGKGGCSAKRFVCQDTSYLECVVDCLTMCQNEHVIKEAKQFLQNLCIGNTSKNLVMISKYVISLLPCDFNPQIQAMACDVLQGIINQNGDVAASCCTLIVDVLKSNYDDALVDVGNVCLAIMRTETADEILFHLIEAAQPYNLLENLSLPGVVGDPAESEFEDAESSVKSEGVGIKEGTGAPPLESDPYFRLQYGAIYVLSYMVKNMPECADWMIERGVIGSLLSGIGTPCYTSVQLEAIRLLLLLHELSPDCALALPRLLPHNILTALLKEQEDVLHYVTAVTCLVLRKLGTRVQENWTAWFSQVTSPDSETSQKRSIPQLKKDEVEGEEEDDEDVESVTEYNLYEIDVLVEMLAQSLVDPFVKIVEGMKLMYPDPSVVESYMDRPSMVSSVSRSMTVPRYRDKGSLAAEEHILETEALEPFRKYLKQDNVIVEREDEFEKYYAAKFIMASETHSVELDAMQVQALQDAEKAMQDFKDPFNASKVPEGSGRQSGQASQDQTQSQVALGSFFEENQTGQDQMLNL